MRRFVRPSYGRYTHVRHFGPKDFGAWTYHNCSETRLDSIILDKTHDLIHLNASNESGRLGQKCSTH